MLDPLPQMRPVPSGPCSSVNATSQIVPRPTALQLGLNSGGGGGLSVAGSTVWVANTGTYDTSANRAVKLTSSQRANRRVCILILLVLMCATADRTRLQPNLSSVLQ